MTVTPLIIAEYLLPWVLVVLAYPLVVVSVRRIAVTAPRVIASLNTGGQPYSGEHRRPYTSADVWITAMMAVAGWALASEIDTNLPARAGWWSEPLRSSWEISYGFAKVLAVCVAPLVFVVAGLAALTLLTMLFSWLDEPINDGLSPDADEAHAVFPNRLSSMRRAVATWRDTRHRTAAGHN